MRLLDDLMWKLSGGYGFSKIDYADEYNQIKLGPESQKRLALSSHEECCCNVAFPLFSGSHGQTDNRPSGCQTISKTFGFYFCDQEKGLRCHLEKCSFAQPSIEYLGFMISNQSIAKGHRVDAIVRMLPPTDVTSLRSFLGSVQFYKKFLHNLATTTEPLYRLTKKEIQWKWGAKNKQHSRR